MGELSSRDHMNGFFIKLEAMSPSEFKVGSTELQIWYGIHETLFGMCLIATTATGICNLYFLNATVKKTAEDMLHAEWINATIICDQQLTKEICHRIFDPVCVNISPLVLNVKGTNFQIQVWRALLKVAFASVSTYQDVAESIACPTAARAVGNAIGKNPVGYLIPCHRVIRSSGKLGGYRWGLERKKLLLEWEASQQEEKGDSLKYWTMLNPRISGF